METCYVVSMVPMTFNSNFKNILPKLSYYNHSWGRQIIIIAKTWLFFAILLSLHVYLHCWTNFRDSSKIFPTMQVNMQKQQNSKKNNQLLEIVMICLPQLWFKSFILGMMFLKFELKVMWTIKTTYQVFIVATPVFGRPRSLM